MDGDDAPTTGTPEHPARLDFDGIDFVTSDQHFGHARIIELAQRPYADVEQMNAALIENWNRVVGPEDTVLHLGDLALGRREETIPVTAALNGHRLLIPGNHDIVSSTYRAGKVAKARDLELLGQAGWEVLPETVIGARGGRRLLASHFPYEGDSHGADRFVHARPLDTGLPLLHGHTHSRSGGPHGREFHVGVDGNDFTPVAMSIIDAWLGNVPDESEANHG